MTGSSGFGDLTNLNTLCDPDGTEANVFARPDGKKALAVDAVVAPITSLVVTGCSSTTELGANATFTGSWTECIAYTNISIIVYADVASGTRGLSIEYSADGSNVIDNDTFTVPADNGCNYSFGVVSRYFRVKYTNGSSAQGNFILQTILHPFAPKPSSHNINTTNLDEADAELVRAVLAAKNPGGTYTNIDCTTGGNLKSSIEEIDPTVTSGPAIPIAGQYNSTLPTVTNGNQNVIQIDSSGRLLVSAKSTSLSQPVIDFAHYMIHIGRTFSHEDITTLNNTQTYSRAIVPPTSGTRVPHFYFSVDSSQDTLIEIFEGATLTLGTEVVPFNRNRGSANTNTTKLYQVNSITSTGTLFCTSRIINTGGTSKGGANAEASEYILKVNTTYLFRITSNGNSNTIIKQIEWYEYDYTSATG